jgi:hypothetical protein
VRRRGKHEWRLNHQMHDLVTFRLSAPTWKILVVGARKFTSNIADREKDSQHASVMISNGCPLVIYLPVHLLTRTYMASWCKSDQRHYFCPTQCVTVARLFRTKSMNQASSSCRAGRIIHPCQFLREIDRCSEPFSGPWRHGS